MLNAIIMNILGPLIIWKTQKLPAIVQFHKIEDGEFIGDMNEQYKKLNDSLLSLGFLVVGSSVLPDSNSKTFFRLFWNDDTKVCAICVCGRSALGDVSYVEFSQRYSDGSVLDVSNNPVAGVYPKSDKKIAYRYPSIVDAEELLSAFNKLRFKKEKSHSFVDYDIDRGFSDIEEYMKRESNELVKKGIIKPEIDEDGKRSLTPYGAIYITYRAISPGKDILGYFQEKMAKKVLGNV